MPQQTAWEKEYNNPLLLTKKSEPQSDTLKFLRFFRKQTKKDFVQLRILDLGCGVGRNANYLAEKGADVVGLDISQAAIREARKRSQELNLNVDYQVFDMGSQYPFGDNEFDMVLDVTSSNSLSEKERDIYLKEVCRVLKSGGYFYVKALKKEGDKNVKYLLKNNPGKEKDTYINPHLELQERVFTREDLVDLYGAYFEIAQIQSKVNYQKIRGNSYKRNYWLLYLIKK